MKLNAASAVSALAAAVVALFAAPALPCSVTGPAGQSATAFPDDGAAGVPTNSDVFLDEDNAGPLNVVVDATLAIEAADALPESVPVELDGNGDVYRIDLPALLAGTTYLVTVRNSDAFHGNDSDEPRVIRLTTGDGDDVEAPLLEVPEVNTRPASDGDFLVLCGDFDSNTTIVDIEAEIDGAVAARLFDVDGEERTLLRELFVAGENFVRTQISDKRAGIRHLELVVVDAAGNESKQAFDVDLGLAGGCAQTSSSTVASAAVLALALALVRRRRSA